MPSAPTKPMVAITLKTLEFYCLTHFCCPQLSISAFVKTLSDIHLVSRIWFNCCSPTHSFSPSSNPKSTWPANFLLHLMSTLLYKPKLTAASINPSVVSPRIGIFTMPAQRVHTSWKMRPIFSLPCYLRWMVMTPSSASFAKCLTLTLVREMDQVESEQIQGLFLRVSTYQERMWTIGPQWWCKSQWEWQRKCVCAHDPSGYQVYITFRMIPTSTHVQSSGKIWKMRSLAICGGSLMRQASSWPSADMALCWSSLIWSEVVSSTCFCPSIVSFFTLLTYY